jgi:Lantibiotic dehydratase, N terminus
MDDAIRLPGGWRLWEQFALRGPGFPAAGVLRLAPTGLAVAADKFGPGDALAGPDWAAFDTAFATAAVETAHRLQEVAADPRFRAAVAWQNRPVLARAVDPYVRWTPTAAGRTSKNREREELVAHYWQRFCVKNDTIGFFGPVGWGRLDPSRPGLTVDPGASLVAETNVFYSSWAIDTLAATVAADPELRPWIPPRRVPFIHLTPTEATMPGRRPQPLTPLEHRVLADCDGTRTLADLVERTADATPDDVTAVLERLLHQRLVTWKLDVPAGPRPERDLRALLTRVTDDAVRGRALAVLDAVEAGRDRVAAAADADELCAALAALETRFTELTESESVRSKGATTAPCRALVYSDCRRAATARLGTTVLDALAPLDALLTSAAWLTSELAARVMAAARPVYDRLAERGAVGLADFWFGCMPVLHGTAVQAADAVRREFWARWNAVLGVDRGVRRVRVSAAEVDERVRAAFGERGPVWSAARYLSPDVMVAARDAAAVERGEFEVVLGELHVASNTLGASLYVEQHPAREELFAATARDAAGPRLLPLVAKENKSRLSARIRQSLVGPQDYYVALLDNTADPRRPRVVLGADARVVDEGGELVVELPDGARFAAVDVFGHVLTNLAMDLFRIVPEGGHTPRITVDRLVVARETWRLPAGDLAFADDKHEAKRFVRARHWQAAHEMPRHVFVVSPAEPRPFYVDFDSPVYVNILAKAARRLARSEPDGLLTVTEMLPAPEQTWLTDHEGATYTSELRLVAVDERPAADPV